MIQMFQIEMFQNDMIHNKVISSQNGLAEMVRPISLYDVTPVGA